MKNALILHGTSSSSQENWFPWLHKQLEEHGYKVWTPNLPQANKPNIDRYNQFILSSQWKFDKESIIIGHSSGSVAMLGLLQTLPSDTKVEACYLIGSFKENLWGALVDGLFEKPFDFDNIKTKSRLYYFLHSDNDPYCPLEHAQYLHHMIGGDLIVLPGQKHFSVETFGEEYRKFPYLLKLITEMSLSEKDVVTLQQDLENMGVEMWLDGGWGVDALIGKQTRPHGDIDIVIQKKDVAILISYLQKRNFQEIYRGDSSPWNFMYGDDKAHFIDVHVIEFDENGNGMYGPKKNGRVYPKESLAGIGKLLNIPIRCISAEWAKKFHSGYGLREKDQKDLTVLASLSS